jgi:hypothetical protein
MTIETKELASMRDSFALASDDEQRINSSDSNVFVVVLNDKRKTELLNILEHDHAGKEEHLDELCVNMMVQGITARIRSIEYSEKTKKNAELAKLVAECKNPEELASLLTKLKARS